MVITKIGYSLAALLLLSAQTVLACPEDKDYWVEGRKALIGSYCDLTNDNIKKYRYYCHEYCFWQSDQTCKAEYNPDDFEDIFGAYIDVKKKWVTDNEDELKIGQATRRCVSRYTCSCVAMGTPPGSFNSQLVE